MSFTNFKVGLHMINGKIGEWDNMLSQYWVSGRHSISGCCHECDYGY